MATYLVLNVVFVGVVLGALFTLRALSWQWPMPLVLLVLLLTTAVFDSLLISVGMFHYTEERILGISIGAAPIEDFIYALLAAILIPNLWRYVGRRQHER